MNSLTVRFEFLSPWHMGSGFGEGAHFDAVPVKSPAGLPYIPGRSVKGLLREAVQLAEDFSHVAEGTTEKLFGSRDKEKSRYESVSGTLCFSNASLGEAMEKWAGENPLVAAQLFMALAATKIDADGLAQDQSLRKIEVALPVTLTATVEAATTSRDWVAALNVALPLLRQAGSHRHRGLGRVAVSIEEVES